MSLSDQADYEGDHTDNNSGPVDTFLWREESYDTKDSSNNTEPDWLPEKADDTDDNPDPTEP